MKKSSVTSHVEFTKRLLTIITNKFGPVMWRSMTLRSSSVCSTFVTSHYFADVETNEEIQSRRMRNSHKIDSNHFIEKVKMEKGKDATSWREARAPLHVQNSALIGLAKSRECFGIPLLRQLIVWKCSRATLILVSCAIFSEYKAFINVFKIKQSSKIHADYKSTKCGLKYLVLTQPTCAKTESRLKATLEIWN
jgi:hypothetical protein